MLNNKRLLYTEPDVYRLLRQSGRCMRRIKTVCWVQSNCFKQLAGRTKYIVWKQTQFLAFYLVEYRSTYILSSFQYQNSYKYEIQARHLRNLQRVLKFSCSRAQYKPARFLEGMALKFCAEKQLPGVVCRHGCTSNSDVAKQLADYFMDPAVS